MPKTNAELAKDVEIIRLKQGEQDVHNVKIDTILEALVTQSGKFEEAIKSQSESLQRTIQDFTTALSPLAIATAKQQERNEASDRFKPLLIGLLGFVIPGIITIGIYILTH